MGILYAWKHSTLVKLVLFMGYAPTPVDTASSAQAISHAYIYY